MPPSSLALALAVQCTAVRRHFGELIKGGSQEVAGSQGVIHLGLSITPSFGSSP